MKIGLLLFLIPSISVAQPHAKNGKIVETAYFEFHNNFWINLHHFLYQQASGSQQKKLQEDGNSLLDIGEAKIWSALTAKEDQILHSAIAYYKENLTGQDLLNDLGMTRVRLQATESEIVADSVISLEYAKVLNNVSKVYRKRFWKLHQQHNEKTISKHMSMISGMEEKVISRMVVLSQSEWPLTESKVRIDLTTYANYAGAYTPTRPNFNILLSTLDPTSETNGFIEIIFHESSHLLFRFGNPFRDIIYFTAEQLDVPFPRNLWHACLFYLCGKVVQSELADMGISYTLQMDKRSIFSEYNTQNFSNALDGYMNNELTLKEMVAQLLKND